MHVAVFATVPKTGSEAAGSGGEEMVSLLGAAPTVVEMVKSWEQAPETSIDVHDVMEAETPMLNSPVVPTLEDSAPRAEVRLPTLQDASPDQFQIDPLATQLPPSPVDEKKPDPDAEQQERPEIDEVELQPKEEKALKADVNSSGRQEQRAAGSSGGSNAGNTATATVSTAEQGKKAKLKAVWGAKIRNKIARFQRYPRGDHGNGRVVVRILVARDGRFANTQILRSSGVSALDKAAVAAVRSAKRGPKAPKGLEGETFSFKIALNFSR
ncbi:energy transducer TonB [Shimia sp.]|uniref:energy transducer TonB n=1 Tax=Shimia sp. TaxID=1954381 RepID=UPI003BAAA307